MLLQSKTELRDYLNSYINSREWWVLIPSSEEVYSGAIIEIEGRFYSGAASKDFIAILSPTRVGLISVYLAKKSRMSAADLRDLIGPCAALPLTEEQLRTHDVVFLSGWQESQRLITGLADLTQV